MYAVNVLHYYQLYVDMYIHINVDMYIHTLSLKVCASRHNTELRWEELGLVIQPQREEHVSYTACLPTTGMYMLKLLFLV